MAHQPLPGINELDTLNEPIPSLDFNRANIGRAVAFTDGPFAGITLRAELTELQKADLGRKSLPCSESARVRPMTCCMTVPLPLLGMKRVLSPSWFPKTSSGQHNQLIS
ncbi:hypothetical protein BDW22DRAFT_406229 [Trametopsis cervina]|nr:hypothetical protein BDW22DRAFT_406229 [Trametopsis cervina]